MNHSFTVPAQEKSSSQFYNSSIPQKQFKKLFEQLESTILNSKVPKEYLEQRGLDYQLMQKVKNQVDRFKKKMDETGETHSRNAKS